MKILKFSSEHCQPCTKLELLLDENDIANYVSIDIDTEEGATLVAKYSVRAVPACVKLDDEGNVLDMFSGIKPLSFIKEFFEVE